MTHDKTTSFVRTGSSLYGHLLGLLLLLLCAVGRSSAFDFIAGSMSHVVSDPSSCASSQTCSVIFRTRLTVRSSPSSSLLTSSASVGSWSFGDGTVLDASDHVPTLVENNTIFAYETYAYVFSHEYELSSTTTFGDACALGEVGCAFDVTFVANNSTLSSEACTSDSSEEDPCRMNAAGGTHRLSTYVYDLSRNAGSPVLASRPLRFVYAVDSTTSDPYAMTVFAEDQVDVRTEQDAAFKRVSLLSWSTFTSDEGERPYNAHEWEDVRTGSVSPPACDPATCDRSSYETTTLAESSEGAFEYYLATNVTTDVVTNVNDGTYPKRMVTTAITYAHTICVNETTTWDAASNETSYPACGEGSNWTNANQMCASDYDSYHMFTCLERVASQTNYSGFMRRNDGAASGSGLPIANADDLFTSVETGTTWTDTAVEVQLRTYADDTTEVSQSRVGYYFVKVDANDGNGAVSSAQSSMAILSELRACTNTPTFETCAEDSDCNAVDSSCTAVTRFSTVTSNARDPKIVRSVDCLVRFEVTASGPGGDRGYGPTAVVPFNVPRGATFGSCVASGTNLTCAFEWTPDEMDVGDHLVCFSAVDGAYALSPEATCQSVRVLPTPDALAFSTPSLGSVQKCASKSVDWIDGVVAVGNTNEVEVHLCTDPDDETTCDELLGTYADDATTCSAFGGLCSSFTWDVSESVAVGSYALKISSTVIACQPDLVVPFDVMKKNAPYSVISPGGVDVCNGAGWYKGCSPTESGDDNRVQILTQESVNVSSVYLRESVAGDDNTYVLASNVTYASGTHVLEVSLTEDDGANAWLVADASYDVVVSSTCYADATATFAPEQRESTFAVTIDDNDQDDLAVWYPCLDHTIDIISFVDSDAVRVSLANDTVDALPDFDTTLLFETSRSTQYVYAGLDTTVSPGTYAIRVNDTSTSDACAPPHETTIEVRAFAEDTIQVTSPSMNASFPTCVASNVLASFSDAFASLGDVRWTAYLNGSAQPVASSADANATENEVTPDPAHVGTWTFVFDAADDALTSCVPSVNRTVEVVPNDQPLTFLGSFPTTWYSCGEVEIRWFSAYPGFEESGYGVNVTLHDAATGELVAVVDANNTAQTATWEIPSTFASGSYALVATLADEDAVSEACLGSASVSVEIVSLSSEESEITFTSVPNEDEGIFMCNAFNFQWDFDTAATTLDVCVCQNCTDVPENCVETVSGTSDLNYAVNTQPDGFEIGTAMLFVGPPSDKEIANCVDVAKVAFEIVRTFVTAEAPEEGDEWLPFCEYELAWTSPFKLGPLRVDLCVNGNCTSEATRTTLMEDTMNDATTFIVDPSAINGWDDPDASGVVLSVVVTATDYDGATVYDGCGYQAVVSNVRVAMKEEPLQTDCRDVANAAYVNNEDTLDVGLVAGCVAAGVVLVLGVLYVIRARSQSAAAKEERAVELRQLAKTVETETNDMEELATENDQIGTAEDDTKVTAEDRAAMDDADEKIRRTEKTLASIRMVQDEIKIARANSADERSLEEDIGDVADAGFGEELDEDAL